MGGDLGFVGDSWWRGPGGRSFLFQTRTYETYAARQDPNHFVAFLLLLPLALLAAAAPFGATILGGVAIAQIKRSRGRIYGLPLAAADLLLYPMLLLAALVLVTALFVGTAIVQAMDLSCYPPTVFAVCVLATLVVCFLLPGPRGGASVRWRRVPRIFAGKMPRTTRRPARTRQRS